MKLLTVGALFAVALILEAFGHSVGAAGAGFIGIGAMMFMPPRRAR